MSLLPLALNSSLPLGVTVALYALAGLVLALIAFQVQLGWSLFRYATRRTREEDFTPPSAIPPENLDWLKTVAVARERLMLGSFQEWELVRDGLDLKGLFFPARPHDRQVAGGRGCAVIVHGWRNIRMARAPDVQFYLDQGYSVFLPSLRGHWPSGGKRIDIGCKHYRDLFAWMEEIRERQGESRPDFFILDGLSMGAANVLTASGDPDLPADIAAVIADCGYTSLKAQGKWMIRGMKAWLRLPAFFFATVFFYLLMGYRGKDPSPLTGAGRTSLPVMIIHGTEDVFVPVAMAGELYEACGSPVKEIWYVEGASHALSFAVAGEDYRRRKRAFIEKALESFQPES